MLQLCVCRDIEHLGSLESTQEAEHSLFVICDWWISIRFVSFGVSSSLLVILL